ncbi:MAG: methyltransferase domain-containing protein [Anaerolineaceae bacterium]|nr:methyltransferase domain-containing protein [Anaerolineaceae bacterium]
MKKLIFKESWPETWKYSYPYDLMEIYGDLHHPGYTYAYVNRYKATLSLVRKVAKPGAKILDVAGAQGNFTLSLAEIGYEVTWNDLREELIDYVKLKWEFGIVHYAPGNVFELGFDASFDVILITEIIEHVAHPDDFLIKIARMVRPGGYIVMSTPNGEYFRYSLPKFSECLDPSQYEASQFKPNADGHIFLLHLDEVHILAKKAGLQVVETKLTNNPITNGHLRMEPFLKIIPRGWIEASEKVTNSLSLPFQKKLHTGLVALLAK